MAKLKGESVEVVYIDTTEGNQAARKLYEGAWFEPFLRTIHFKHKVE